MLWVVLAGIWAFLDGLEPHQTHQPAHTVATGMEPISRQVNRDLAAAEERILREHAVDLRHQFQRLSIHTNGHVIQRRPADIQQFTLAGQAQIRVIPIDHRFAFVRAHRFSTCDKARGTLALQGRVSPRIVFDRQLPDFGMQLFDFGLIVLSLPDLVRKHARQTINRLSLPRRYLCRMDLVLGRNLLRRPVSTQRLKRYRGLKLI